MKKTRLELIKEIQAEKEDLQEVETSIKKELKGSRAFFTEYDLEASLVYPQSDLTDIPSLEDIEYIEGKFSIH